jgi:hypothetical protein
MKALLACVLLFSGFAATLGSASDPPPSSARLLPGDGKVIDQFVSGLARKQGGEVPEEIPRAVLTGDLNRDGIADVAVLFTIEGPGNNYGQYLGVFVRRNGKLVAADHAAVGGKLYRAVKMTSIQDGVIHLSTTSYAEKDPACCPTIKGSTQYELVDGKLKEMPRH